MQGQSLGGEFCRREEPSPTASAEQEDLLDPKQSRRRGARGHGLSPGQEIGPSCFVGGLPFLQNTVPMLGATGQGDMLSSGSEGQGHCPCCTMM